MTLQLQTFLTGAMFGIVIYPCYQLIALAYAIYYRLAVTGTYKGADDDYAFWQEYFKRNPGELTYPNPYARAEWHRPFFSIRAAGLYPEKQDVEMAIEMEKKRRTGTDQLDGVGGAH